ncbi:hypothetical protein C3F09_08230 [candidate division GN15 bacterium]|uniref:Uncharacterized protein n=1 Tax=candidate division GN15 bacterium TaxID=2072418 RepID=A0A855X4S6_9BACT|nr:MAG: hypothetical protein C3F09_08230 [candidate division GN15 bacterium]
MSISTATVACCLFLAGAAFAADGSGSVRVGYTIVDDTGSLGVNQETYNTYEGAGISVENFRYLFSNGMTFGADLRNVSLNNRNMRAILGKPGQFSVAFNNSQYRRVYTFDGSQFTRRRQTGVQAMYQPGRYFKFFGGFNLNDKSGATASILDHSLDTIIASTDYRQTSFNLGGQVGDRYGVVRIDYRHTRFDDRLTTNYDRRTDRFSASVSSSVPRFKRLFVAGGFTYRKDSAQVWQSSLRTNELWGAFKAYFSGGFLAEYRVIYDMTKHVGYRLETDNIAHTLSLGKNWGRIGGIQAGYERRIVDDFIDKTSSNGFIGNAWYRPTQHWSFSARTSLRDKSVDEGMTLTGDESVERYRVVATYTDTAWGFVTARFQANNRTSDDLDSKIQYRSLAPAVGIKTGKFGRFEGSYSYSTGKFWNRSQNIGYEFLDHLLSGTFYLPTWRNLTADVGATYYRSKRGQDLEKSHLNFGARYTIQKEYHLEVRYNVFNYDNFLLNNSYYTGNIVEINFIKDFTF